MKIVETDTFDNENCNEYFLRPLPALSEKDASAICNILNSTERDRHYKPVLEDYKLRKFHE